MLRAQVERLQAEVREYRKRLSWISRESSFSALSALQSVNTRNLSGLNNDFVFDFPRFGELSTNQISSNGTGIKPTARAQSISNDSSSSVRASASPSSRDHNNTLANGHHQNSVDSSFVGGYHHQTGTSSYSASNTGSPSTSSESQNAHISSQGTSPEPAYSPPKTNGTENEQRSDYCEIPLRASVGIGRSSTKSKSVADESDKSGDQPGADVYQHTRPDAVISRPHVFPRLADAAKWWQL